MVVQNQKCLWCAYFHLSRKKRESAAYLPAYVSMCHYVPISAWGQRYPLLIRCVSLSTSVDMEVPAAGDNSDEAAWRGNSSPFCFLLFNTELHLNVRNLEKVSPSSLVSPVGPEKSEQIEPLSILWSLLFIMRCQLSVQNGLCTPACNTSTPDWQTGSPFCLHTGQIGYIPTLIFIFFGILCQIIHSEQYKNWDAFLQKFSYILWIVE